MPVQRTFSCTKDVKLVRTSGGVEGGIGAGNVLSVGQLPNGSKTRSEMEYGCDFSGAVDVASARLRLRVSDHCGPIGSAVKFWVEQLTDGFKEGDEKDTCGVGNGNAEEWPGQSSSTTNRAEYTGSPSDGDVLSIDITALVEAARVANAIRLPLRLIASDGAGDYEEDNANRYCGFWSREKGNTGQGFKPRIEVVLNTTHAPNAPADVSPATADYQGADERASRVDRTFTVRGRFTSANGGEYLSASQVQFFPRTATDNASFVVSNGTEIQTIAGSGVKSDYPVGTLNMAHTVTVPSSLVGVEIRGRVRHRGSRGRWGDWTRLAAMRIRPNTRPSAPTGLSVNTGSSTPDFRGRHNDADRGSTVSAVETQVVHETDGGVQVLMNHTSRAPGDPTSGLYVTSGGSGPDTVPAGGTTWQISYDGPALKVGWRVKRRHRTVDQFGAVGAWSPWQTWIVGESPVPTPLPSPATKQDTLEPLVGASYTQAINAIQVQVWRTAEAAADAAAAKAVGKPMWSSGTVTASGTSKRVEYGSVGTLNRPLAWGDVVYGIARVRIAATNNWSPWTDVFPITINSLPLAPVVGAEGAVLDSGGVWRVPSKTPRLTCAFLDPDLPGDSPSKQIAQVFTVPAGSTPLWSQTLTAGIEQFADVPVSAGLAWETAYLARVRYADTSLQLGPFGLFYFTTHRPPTVTAGTAPDENDPTPTINWAATFYAGATQLGYQVLVDDVTGGSRSRVLDTGFVEDTSATSYGVPAYTLEDAHDYEVFVYVTDTFGIAGLLAGANPQASAAAAGAAATTMSGITTGASAPADTFTRTVSDGWGTSSSGFTYDLLGTAADFDVAATVGTIAVSATETKKAHFHGATLLNPTVAVKVKTDKLAVGAAIVASANLRCVDLANHYRAALVFNPGGTVDLKVQRIVGSAVTLLATYRTAISHATGTYYWIKFAVSGTSLSAKAWVDGDAEPGYQITVTDDAAVLAVAGSVGMGAAANAGITNAPVLFTFDDFSTS